MKGNVDRRTCRDRRFTGRGCVGQRLAAKTGKRGSEGWARGAARWSSGGDAPTVATVGALSTTGYCGVSPMIPILGRQRFHLRLDRSEGRLRWRSGLAAERSLNRSPRLSAWQTRRARHESTVRGLSGAEGLRRCRVGQTARPAVNLERGRRDATSIDLSHQQL